MLFTHKLYQPHLPRTLHHSSEEEELMQEEIQSMLRKQAKGYPTQGAGLSINCISHPKERLRPAACDRPQSPEQVHAYRALQNGGHSKRPAQGRGLDGEGGLERRIFHDTDHEWDRAFLKFSFGGQMYQFKCLPCSLACAP